MTVAVGTLNGLIFYANVVYVNKSILLPFQETNFVTVFISWLNLDLGIDTCYFPGMDTYIKMWLQFAFPVYVLLLVYLVILQIYQILKPNSKEGSHHCMMHGNQSALNCNYWKFKVVRFP